MRCQQVESLYGAFFVKELEQPSFFLHQFSLFDLKARFFVPTTRAAIANTDWRTARVSSDGKR